MIKRILSFLMAFTLCVGLTTAKTGRAGAMSYLEYLFSYESQPGDLLHVDQDELGIWIKENGIATSLNDEDNRMYAVVGLSAERITSPVERIDVVIYGDRWRVGSLGAVVTVENGATYHGAVKEYADGLHIGFTFDNAISERYELYISIEETSGRGPSQIMAYTNQRQGGVIGGFIYGVEFGTEAVSSEEILNAKPGSVLSLIVVDIYGSGFFRGEPKIPQDEGQTESSYPKYSLLTEPQLKKRTYDISASPYRSAMHLDEEGNIHYLYEHGENVAVKVFDQNLSEIRSFEIPKILPIFGTFTMDPDGNYYIAFGKNITDERSKSEKNVVIAKYDDSGSLIGTTYFIGGEGYYSGTKEPFYSPPSMVISKTRSILVLHFSRTMFQSGDGLNHQSSTALYVDINTMSPLDMALPYVSHSFDQAVVATSDGGFLFADRGDAYPRGFAISKCYAEGYMQDGLERLPRIVPFHFRELSPYQSTNSRLGGIAESSYGYLLAGVSERVLSNIAIPASDGGPQDLFIQLIDKEFYFRHDADQILSDGVTRMTEGIQHELGLNSSGGQSYFLPANTIDYGIVWLTSYSDGQNAVNPKVVATEDGFVLMWERWGPENSGWRSYLDTWYTVLNADGTVEKPAMKINGNPRLSSVSGNSGGISYREGNIYWISNEWNEITLYSLALYDRPSSWAVDQVTAAVALGLVPSELQKNYQMGITRGEAAQMFISLIEKASGQTIDAFMAANEVSINENAFTDTNDRAVLAANALGIIQGVGNNRFDPEGVLTRAHVAVIVNRIARVLGINTEGHTHSFIDVHGHWADVELGWPEYAGVIQGTGGNRFDPDASLSTEMAIIVTYRALAPLTK